MKVTFSAKYSVFAVQAEAGTLVSLTGTPTEVADGIYTVGDSGVVIVNEGTYTDSIYLSTTGSDYTVDRNARIATVAEGVQVWVGSSPLDCPFPKSRKGGGSGGGVIIFSPLKLINSVMYDYDPIIYVEAEE